ncbi:hypothetical protein HAZT_HAZT002922 [Hyalella azteca]|nr:hypothetical protein HAZT_HAZT002922 [Hyalella azteca]
MSKQSDLHVTSEPEILRFEIEMPSEKILSSSVISEASVTAMPEDAVTVRYVVEGEEMSVTVSSALHDILSPSADEDSNVTTPDPKKDVRPLTASSFACYNSSHYLTLEGHNTSFFVTKIVKRAKQQGNLVAEAAESLFPQDDNDTNTTTDPCHCYLWQKPDPLPTGEVYILGVSWTEGSYYVRICCEILTALGSLAYIVGAAREARFQGLQMFFENLSTVPSRVLFLFACVMVMFMVVMRLMCQGVIEDCLAVMAMLCTGPYFLFFCRGFKTVGPFVTMIYTMLVGDLLRFVTIYFVFVMGFSQAYYVIYTSYMAKAAKSHCKTNPLSTPVESVMNMFIMSLGNFGSVYEGTECTAHETSGKVLFIVFMAIVSLLLINLLIAMMGNTYTIIAEMKNEWMRQWARIVLVVERGVNPEERLRQQKIYSQPMADGRPALVLRLHQDEEERDEMRDVLDMKRVHRKYVQRRLAKQQRAANAAANANAKTNEPGTRDPVSGAIGK